MGMDREQENSHLGLPEHTAGIIQRGKKFYCKFTKDALATLKLLVTSARAFVVVRMETK